MASWKAIGRLGKGLTKLGAKAAVQSGKLAIKGVAAGAGAVYEKRGAIKAAAEASAKVAGKAVMATGRIAYRGSAAAAKAVYENRESIRKTAGDAVEATASALSGTAKTAYKAGASVTRVAYEHREEVAGALVGAATGTALAVRDASGHLVRDEDLRSKVRAIERESRRYHQLSEIHALLIREYRRKKSVLLDTLLVGGETVASYVRQGHVPEDVQRAYELAYPHVAASHSFVEQIESLQPDGIVGFTSGVKGKLFEMQYVEHLNEGNLPSGYFAELAQSATQPRWDIAIRGPEGAFLDIIQAKATESTGYVKQALDAHPHIDVVTTTEVHANLMMQGFAENVIDSGISDAAISANVEGVVGDATVSMSWMPSTVAFAVIAFSAYSKDGLTAYAKSREVGERSAKSYLAYLAGGAFAVASNTWWIGVIAGMGSRVILETGRKKRERADELDQLLEASRSANRRLEAAVT